MTMHIEPQEYPTVEFIQLQVGQCFLDGDKDYCMKVEPKEAGRYVVLHGRHAGAVVAMKDHAPVRPIVLRSQIVA